MKTRKNITEPSTGIEETNHQKDDVKKDYDRILDNFELTICIICGEEVDAYWDPRYKGIRASCIHCEINWAES